MGVVKVFLSILRFLRVHHYIKNLLVFTNIILTFHLFNTKYLLTSIYGFIIFCLSASVVYIINDLRDLENDKKHPVKKNRPLPSGQIPIMLAYVILCILFLCLAAMSLFLSLLSENTAHYFIIPAIYVIINLAYSMGLKNIPILDVFILMAGYVLRVLYGSIIIRGKTSGWVFLTMMSFSFFLGFGKRRNELRKFGTGGRKILSYYTQSFLDRGIQLSLSMAVIFYSLASNDTGTVPSQNEKSLIWSVPVLFVLCLRYMMLLESDCDGDPVSMVLSDRWLRLITVVYVILVFLLLYVL